MLTLYRLVKGEKHVCPKHIQALNWFHGQRQCSTNHPVVSYYENGMSEHCKNTLNPPKNLFHLPHFISIF